MYIYQSKKKIKIAKSKAARHIGKSIVTTAKQALSDTQVGTPRRRRRRRRTYDNVVKGPVKRVVSIKPLQNVTKKVVNQVVNTQLQTGHMPSKKKIMQISRDAVKKQYFSKRGNSGLISALDALRNPRQ